MSYIFVPLCTSTSSTSTRQIGSLSDPARDARRRGPRGTRLSVSQSPCLRSKHSDRVAFINIFSKHTMLLLLFLLLLEGSSSLDVHHRRRRRTAAKQFIKNLRRIYRLDWRSFFGGLFFAFFFADNFFCAAQNVSQLIDLDTEKIGRNCLWMRCDFFHSLSRFAYAWSLIKNKFGLWFCHFYIFLVTLFYAQ